MGEAPRQVAYRWERADDGINSIGLRRERLVAWGSGFRRFHYWSPLDWYRWARYTRWARKNF